MTEDPRTTPPRKTYVPHKPEQRLSIAVARFLHRTLQEPFFASALHDADEGLRTENQRARDRVRGILSGCLDWEIWQGPDGLARRLELKRGKNNLSDNQKIVVSKLTACGAPPVVAWSLREVFDGLKGQGFQFLNNAEIVLADLELRLRQWDQKAEALKTGATPAKPASKAKPKPRYVAGKAIVKRAHASGIMM